MLNTKCSKIINTNVFVTVLHLCVYFIYFESLYITVTILCIYSVTLKMIKASSY